MQFRLPEEHARARDPAPEAGLPEWDAREHPRSSIGEFVALQRLVGNQAVQRLLSATTRKVPSGQRLVQRVKFADFIGNDQKQGEASNAWDTAKQLCDAAVGAIDDDADSATFHDCFGQADPAKVVEGYRKARAKMNSPAFELKFAPDPAVYSASETSVAETSPEQQRILLFPAFFGLADDAQALSILHEMTHAAFMSEDYNLNMADLDEGIKTLSDSQKVNCAYCYELFASRI